MAVSTTKAASVVVSIGSTVLGCWTSAAINFSAEILDTACAATVGYSGREVGKKDVTMTLDMRHRVETTTNNEFTIDDFIAAWAAGTKLTISFKVNVNGAKEYVGDFVVESSSVSAAINGDVTGSASLGIDGELEINDVTIP